MKSEKDNFEVSFLMIFFFLLGSRVCFDFSNEFSSELIKNSVQHAFLTKFCEHLSPAHLAPDSRPASFRAPTDVLCPAKGPLPVAGLRSRRGGPTSCVLLGFSLPPFPAGCLWMDYRWSEKDFLAQWEDQSPALCGKGFITGWQFMPTKNRPGCCSLAGKADSLWRHSVGGGIDRRKGMLTFRWHLSSRGLSNCHLFKGVGLCRDTGAWGIRPQVTFLVCGAHVGSLHVFPWRGTDRCCTPTLSTSFKP